VAREIQEREPNRSVEFAIEGGMLAVGDLPLIRAVLTNLIGNAWKFTSKSTGPRIEIGKQSDECETIFFVRDNGAGFDMKQAEKLFVIFERLHKQEEFPGTGIGLATVKRIISKHGGRIWAEGHPNQGATFFFTLPSEI
jgi:light-regulated signal transduction histidine kinase (bacteriophytochrome)